MVIQFEEAYNLKNDNVPFYLSSLDQFSKYQVRIDIIKDILNYKLD